MKKRSYKFGVFYYDKDEPRLFIDESFNLSRAFAVNGHIVNFAHWKKLAGILGVVLLFVVLVVLAIMMFR